VGRERQSKRNRQMDLANLCRQCGQRDQGAGRLCLDCWMRRKALQALGDPNKADDLRALWERQAGRCALTGLALVPGQNASLDHVTPRSRGGGDELGNLRWTDTRANTARSNLSDAEFLALCAAVVMHAAQYRHASNDNATATPRRQRRGR
jgi:5-methylcytosine-specific restriction endonuclease McrA